MTVATCAECEREGVDQPFRVPWGDFIGAELMIGHYEQAHGVKLKYGLVHGVLK
jgi:hypothetical protein